jgi:hypothetical protein
MYFSFAIITLEPVGKGKKNNGYWLGFELGLSCHTSTKFSSIQIIVGHLQWQRNLPPSKAE